MIVEHIFKLDDSSWAEGSKERNGALSIHPTGALERLGRSRTVVPSFVSLVPSTPELRPRPLP